MSDLFGFSAPSRPFKDVRNQRPSIAERKAELLLELGALLNKVPLKVRDGSVQTVRQWQFTRAAAAKIAANRRSSIDDLTRAIGSMASYREET
jgi:hypothetical protein